MAAQAKRIGVRKGTFSLVILVAYIMLGAWASALVTFGSTEQSEMAIKLLGEVGYQLVGMFGVASGAGTVMHYAEKKHSAPKLPLTGDGGIGGEI